MDCILFPSLWEGLSFVLIEAQANGITIIASNKISTEHKLTNNIYFLPIYDEKLWSDFVGEFGRFTRNDNAINELRCIGYDINNNSKRLEKLYMEMYKR